MVPPASTERARTVGRGWRRPPGTAQGRDRIPGLGHPVTVPFPLQGLCHHGPQPLPRTRRPPAPPTGADLWSGPLATVKDFNFPAGPKRTASPPSSSQQLLTSAPCLGWRGGGGWTGDPERPETVSVIPSCSPSGKAKCTNLSGRKCRSSRTTP